MTVFPRASSGFPFFCTKRASRSGVRPQARMRPSRTAIAPSGIAWTLAMSSRWRGLRRPAMVTSSEALTIRRSAVLVPGMLSAPMPPDPGPGHPFQSPAQAAQKRAYETGHVGFSHPAPGLQLSPRGTSRQGGLRAARADAAAELPPEEHEELVDVEPVPLGNALDERRLRLLRRAR